MSAYNIYHKARRALTFLEHWEVFAQRNKLGIDADLYIKLDKPWFRSLGIRSVVDIGAHKGLWARTIKRLLPEATVHSFEPIPELYAELTSSLSGKPGHVLYNVGLGDHSGTEKFNLNEFSASSSFMGMAEAHVKAFPFTARTKSIEVRMQRLDEALEGVTLEAEIFIKMDVQGFEDKVISGGPGTLGRARAVLMEVSYVHLYEGQPLFGDIHSLMRERGFRLAGFLDQLHDPQTGLPMQADALFVRKG